MLELLTRPLIIVFRFGIEMDEALKAGGSGFPGESDAEEEDEGSALAGFPKVGETLIVDTLDLEHHA
ncbi:MAG: hypothetical protein VX208_04850 [SAR324 cluster bacterium]|nr:hypothetical protein [SAR324 cluster bacterium]